MTNYTKRAVRGAGIIFLMSMLASVLAYVTRIVLARNLGPAEYGSFSSVLTFVIFFLFFRDLGFPSAIIKYTSHFAATKEYGKIKSVLATALSVQMLVSIIFVIIFYVLADFLAAVYFKNQETALFLKMFVVYIFGSVFFITSKDLLLGLQKNFLFSLGELLKNGIILVLILFFLKQGYQTLAPVYAYALVCWILFMFFFPFLIASFPFYKYRLDDFSAVSRKVCLFALPVFATAVGGKVIAYIDTLILTYFRSSAEVGIYNAVLPSALLFLYFGTAIGSVTMPLASELIVKHDNLRLIAGIKSLYHYLFAAVIPLMAVAFAFSGFFLEVFFGKEYIVGAGAFQILLLGILVFMLASINHTIFAAFGKPWIVTKIILFAAVINASFNLLLIPKFGIIGAAFSTTLSYILAFALSVWKMRQLLHFKVPLKIWTIQFLLGILLVIMLFEISYLLHMSPWLEVIFSFVLGTIIYVLLLYLFKVIDITEIKKYLRLVQLKY